MNGYRISRVVTPATSLALVTLDEAKAALGIDTADTSQDAALTMQIDAVSQAVSNYCSRIFPVQVYRDQIRGHCGGFGEPLLARQWPIAVDTGGVALLTVSENGAALTPSAIEVATETGLIYRLDGAATPTLWAAALLVLDYTAGYDPIPADVRSASLEWLTARWQATGRDPTLRSETIPDVITQVYASDNASGNSVAAMPTGARQWLAPYKLWFV